MQKSLENKKSFGKQAKKPVPFIKTYLIPQWYLHQKNKVRENLFSSYPFNLDKNDENVLRETKWFHNLI